MDVGRTNSAHQPEGAPGNIESIDGTAMDGQEHQGDVGQYGNYGICEQLRRDSVPSSPSFVSPHMEFLPANRHQTTSPVRCIHSKSSRCSMSPDGIATRMEDSCQILCPSRLHVGFPHDGYVRSSKQSPSPSLCDLEARPESPIDECHVDGLATNRPTTSLPSMGSATISDRQDSERTRYRDTGNPMVDISYLVPNSETNGSTKTTEGSSKDCASASRTSSKRPARESTLVARCLESKIRRIEVAGADPNVTDIVMRTNPRRCIRYAQVQARFLGWSRDRFVEPKQPSSLLNFLAYGHANLGWSFQTLANYRSS